MLAQVRGVAPVHAKALGDRARWTRLRGCDWPFSTLVGPRRGPHRGDGLELRADVTRAAADRAGPAARAAAPLPPPQVVIAAPPPPAPLPPPDPTLFEPSRVALTLEDPRLAAVKVEADREAFPRAASAMSAAMTATPPSAEERPSWLYQLGRLRALGGDPAGAAKAFQESAATPWALADYAHLQAAQWLVGTGQFDAALAEARAIGRDAPIAGPVDLVMADALLGKNDLEGAAARFRAYLGRDKRAPQWATVALRFANALLQRPSEAHAEEAYRLARRLIEESPGGPPPAAGRTSRSRLWTRSARASQGAGEALAGRHAGPRARWQARSSTARPSS